MDSIIFLSDCENGRIELIDKDSIRLASSKTIETAFLAACRNGHFEICDLLFSSGVLCDSFNNRSREETPICVAAKGGHLQIVKWLAMVLPSKENMMEAFHVSSGSSPTEISTWLDKEIKRFR